MIKIRILEKLDTFMTTKSDIVALSTYNMGMYETLTYKELIQFADRLAFYLQDTLGPNKTPLIVYGHKSVYMTACFLACVKSGRAYCPVDIGTPSERIEDILRETNTPLVLALEPLELSCENILSREQIMQIGINGTNVIDKKHYVKKEDIFYIIFTSGSTGRPKGVQITEDNLYHFVKWATTLGNIDYTEKQFIFMNQALFSFDLSVMDLYMSLYLGGTLLCLDKTVQADYKSLMDRLGQSETNIWVSTPSFADMCLSGDIFTETLLPDLQLFLFCGETLSNHTADQLNKRFPKAKVINTYGPTESTVAVTEIEITDAISKEHQPLPVGRPKPGTYLQIINSNGKLAEDGEKGEIVIVGDSVSIGYFKRSELNAKAFSEQTIDGQLLRAYRTGDEGYIKDGLLFYCGRIDLQIKLHGYRIEIEDIENNLLKLECIKNVGVIPVKKDNTIESLAAFVVSEGIEHNLKGMGIVKKAAAKVLPTYMIPKRFIFIDSMPMTNNGKKDRKKLLQILSEG